MSDFLNDWWNSDDLWADAFQPAPVNVNELLFGFSDQVDTHAQNLFFEAFINADESKWADFEAYLADEYDIDYDHDAHWEDYREWYLTG